MAVFALVAGALAVVTLVAGLLNHFGNRVEHAWYVSLVAYVSWFFPFSIVVLVPLDLASVIHSFSLCEKKKGSLGKQTKPFRFCKSRKKKKKRL
jgi:hypothetical protein